MADEKDLKVDAKAGSSSGGTGDKARDKVVKTLSASVNSPLAAQIEASLYASCGRDSNGKAYRQIFRNLTTQLKDEEGSGKKLLLSINSGSLPVNTLISQLLAQFTVQGKQLQTIQAEAEKQRVAEEAAAKSNTQTAAQAAEEAKFTLAMKQSKNAITLTSGALDAVAPGQFVPAFTIAKAADDTPQPTAAPKPAAAAAAPAISKSKAKKKKGKAALAAAAAATAADAKTAADVKTAASSGDVSKKVADAKEKERQREEWALRAAKAKFAISTALTDGSFWYQLANVYVDSFADFDNGGAQVHMVLHQAIKAFHSAESAKTNAVKSNPTLYLRRAEASVIVENYTQAIADYKTAAALLSKADAKSGAGGVTSGDAEERAATVVKFVKHVAAFVAARGNLKESKITKQVKELPLPTQLVAGRRVVWSNSLTASTPTSAIVTPGQVMTTPNTGKALLVNIIADITRASVHAHGGSFFAAAKVGIDVSPASFLVMDGEGKFLVLTIYNIAGDIRKAKLVNINDRMFICDPVIRTITTTLPDGSTSSWTAIIAENPRLLFPGYNAWPIEYVQNPLNL